MNFRGSRAMKSPAVTTAPPARIASGGTYAAATPTMSIPIAQLSTRNPGSDADSRRGSDRRHRQDSEANRLCDGPVWTRIHRAGHRRRRRGILIERDSAWLAWVHLRPRLDDLGRGHGLAKASGR